ncbi:MAG: glycosyl transferase family 1 [Candidatus Marinimicrobia bacterium]|nr:glycosyl transferase family 1 [Candidatus Neomarinimicrobiota bacterium]
MKKILINGRFLCQNITGVQRVSIELVKSLDSFLSKKIIDDKTYKIDIIVPRDKMLHDLNLKNIKIIKKGFLKGHLWEQFELPFYSKCDLLFCPGNVAPILSYFFKFKLITTVHDLSYKYFPKAYNWKFRFVYNLIVPFVMKISNYIITVSKSEKDSILNYYPNVTNKIIEIQNGGGEFFKTKITNKINDFNNILYIGSLSKRKNVHGIIEAFMRLKIEKKKLIIVGGNDNIFDDFRISKKINIEFVGQVNDKKVLLSYYKMANVFIFPSFYEASPLPPIEAMSTGCPVICSNIPSLLERCGDSALYCDPNDIDDISEKINEVLINENLRNGLISKGLERAKNFTWNNSAQKTFEIFKKVL